MPILHLNIRVRDASKRQLFKSYQQNYRKLPAHAVKCLMLTAWRSGSQLLLQIQPSLSVQGCWDWKILNCKWAWGCPPPRPQLITTSITDTNISLLTLIAPADVYCGSRSSLLTAVVLGMNLLLRGWQLPYFIIGSISCHVLCLRVSSPSFKSEIQIPRNAGEPGN